MKQLLWLVVMSVPVSAQGNPWTVEPAMGEAKRVVSASYIIREPWGYCAVWLYKDGKGLEVFASEAKGVYSVEQHVKIAGTVREPEYSNTWMVLRDEGPVWRLVPADYGWDVFSSRCHPHSRHLPPAAQRLLERHFKGPEKVALR